MPRRSRPLQRLLKEQDTVGAQRAERKEQEELAGKKKVEAGLSKSLRGAEFEDDTQHVHAPSPRVARAGKPLKRPKT
jgi:hypothetical protein